MDVVHFDAKSLCPVHNMFTGCVDAIDYVSMNWALKIRAAEPLNG